MKTFYLKHFFKTSLLMLTLLLGTSSWGQANLPFSFNGGRNDISSTTGLSHSGLGSDYGGENPKLKFDTTGDLLTLHFNGIADELSFTIRFNGSGSFGGTYQVVGSTDGTNFDVSLFSLGAHTANSNVTYNVDNIPTNVKYIRWIYTNKSSGNIGLGNINLTGTATSCEQSNLTFANPTVTADLADGTFTQTATSLNETTAITYESSNEAVATVNPSTGEVSLVGVGTTTITATQEAGEDNGTDYCAGTATYELTVITTVPVLTVSANSASFSGFAGGSTSTETITVEGFNLTGNIALALSGDTNFSINPTSLSSTGGEVTITYTPSATPATHSATLTVSNGLLSEEITLSGVTNEMPEEYAGVGTFEKITSTDDLTDGYYVIIEAHTNANAMTNTHNGTFLAPEAITPTENTVENPHTGIVWYIETNGDGHTIYNEVTGKYVSYTGSSNNIQVVDAIATNNQRWTITYTNGEFQFNNASLTTRKLQYNSNSGQERFAAYTTSQKNLLLYKLVGSSSNTTWNGTAWSNGAPTIDVDAIVDGALEISADLAAKSVTVNTNGSVVVKSGNALTVDGAIVNNATAAAFVVENDANLIQVQDVANTGEFTVYRNSNPMERNDMTLWSSPVTGQGVRAFSPETLFNRFWTYNEGTNAYQALFTDDEQDQDFENGLGYAIRVKNTLPTVETTVHEGAFTGNLNNGDVAVNTKVTTSGNNLVGNPYPSNIAVEGDNGFLTANAHVNALYFWTQTYPVGSPNYNNNYQAYSLAGSTSIEAEKNISVGQGFIVNVNNAGQVVFNNAMRTADASTFYRTEIEKNRIWLSLNKEEQKLSQILVAYMTDATNELDHQIDAKVFAKGQASIYTLINNEAYAIQGRALPFDQEDVVALGFEATEQGTYSINIEAVDGLFAEGQEVYLLDKSANKIHDLTTAYTFESEAGIFDERFEVVYANRDLGLNTDLTNSKDVVVYTDNNTIVVESKNATLLSVELIDLQGRTVAAKNNIKANTYRVNTSAKGVLVVKIQTADGNVITKKVIRK